jgi:hypothetical protein
VRSDWARRARLFKVFSQEQAIIAEMRMAAYLMLEGLGMIRGWLRNLHAAL